MKTIDPSNLSPSEVYSILVSVVVPRPIALVSTVSASGISNLAPFSFFMIGGANPPSLMVSPVVGNQLEEKDTLTNVRETGEFVVNLVDYSMRDGMNQASRALAASESEWDFSEFTKLKSDKVVPCRVAESQVQLECKLFQVVEHGNGPVAARYIIGEIMQIHMLPSLMEGKFAPISRLGGADYLDLDVLAKFTLGRPNS